ncbi:N-alpha-acetyltransferase 40 isoform X2 [Eurytemora carolleeae]|nr:N-alpha-acetyltransferase 40 isoform X2 [Eurytemora carolleeae]|eukprot:XP_023344829.1 N-alpha-acetyltransferase 40-like isoform X2 [Eurytemora affinis]
MGRNNEKVKDKKKERKMMSERMNVGWANVKKANSQTDPLDSLPSFRKINKNGMSLNLETARATELNEDTKDWMFKLLESNMKTAYQKSDWGWNEGNKKAELFEEAAWFLIARNDDGTPIAFSHFRFDMDFDDDVLYCYEIQLEPEVRRKGLGRVMMKVLELIMMKADMIKIMLTVFKHNEAATTFFKKSLKYDVDETCPYNTIYEQFDYEILSR